MENLTKNTINGVGTIVNTSSATPLHSHTMPIFQTSTFSFDDTNSALAAFGGGDNDSYVYSRGRNPNAEVLAKKIAHLEARDIMARKGTTEVDDVAACRLFSSGMGAIFAIIASVMKSGDEALVQNSLYGGTHGLWNDILPRFGYSATFINSFEPKQWEAALASNPKVKLIYIESPANPTLALQDIPALAKIAAKYNVRLVVDNTFATPVLQQPLNLGADYVVHSLTKFISGHGAVTAGAVISRDPEEFRLFGEFWNLSVELGACPSPFDCWVTEMGLKTLELRMERHCTNAQQMAEHLYAHPKIKSVQYPGLKTHNHHERAKQHLKGGFGGLLSFELDADFGGVRRLLDALKIPSLAISLGSTDSLIQSPALMTHRNMSPEARSEAGIPDGLIRLSVGIENATDLLADMNQALQEV